MNGGNVCTRRSVEYEIKNLANGLSVCIGGDHESGVVNYIEHYGFYEGGGTLHVHIHPQSFSLDQHSLVSCNQSMKHFLLLLLLSLSLCSLSLSLTHLQKHKCIYGLVSYPLTHCSSFSFAGVLNNYRVDPQLLCAVLTGICTTECLERVEQRQRSEQNLLQQELDYEASQAQLCRQRIDKLKQKDNNNNKKKKKKEEEEEEAVEAELAWISARLRELEKQLDEHRRHSTELINQLSQNHLTISL